MLQELDKLKNNYKNKPNKITKNLITEKISTNKDEQAQFLKEFTKLNNLYTPSTLNESQNVLYNKKNIQNLGSFNDSDKYQTFSKKKNTPQKLTKNEHLQQLQQFRGGNKLNHYLLYNNNSKSIKYYNI